MNKTDDTQDGIPPAIVMPPGGHSDIIASLIHRGLLPAGPTVIQIEQNEIVSGFMRHYRMAQRVSPATMNLITKNVRRLTRAHIHAGAALKNRLMETTAWTSGKHPIWG